MNDYPIVIYRRNYYIDYYYNKKRYISSKEKGNSFIKLIENIVEFLFDKF